MAQPQPLNNKSSSPIAMSFQEDTTTATLPKNYSNNNHTDNPYDKNTTLLNSPTKTKSDAAYDTNSNIKSNSNISMTNAMHTITKSTYPHFNYPDEDKKTQTTTKAQGKYFHHNTDISLFPP